MQLRKQANYATPSSITNR